MIIKFETHHFTFFPVYVDLGPGSTGPTTLSVVTGSGTTARSFSIRVCQIECNSPSKGRNEIHFQVETTTHLLIRLHETVERNS